MIDFLAEIVLPMAMFTMMFAMGLTLSMEDFKQVMVFPKAVLYSHNIVSTSTFRVKLSALSCW